MFAPGSLVQAHVRDGNQDPAIPTVTCDWHPWVVHSGQRLSVLLVPGDVSGCCPGHYRELWAFQGLPSGRTGAPCHTVVGDSCTRGQPAGVRGPPLVAESKESRGGRGHLGGSHVREPICHVWIRLALPQLKISNKEGLLVPAAAAHWPVEFHREVTLSQACRGAQGTGGAGRGDLPARP